MRKKHEKKHLFSGVSSMIWGMISYLREKVLAWPLRTRERTVVEASKGV